MEKMEKITLQEQEPQIQDIKERQQQQIEPTNKKQIKSLEAKFLPYVNQLSSSINRCQSFLSNTQKQQILKQQSLNYQSNSSASKNQKFKTNSLQLLKKAKSSKFFNNSNNQSNNYRESKSILAKVQKSIEYNIVQGSIINGRIHGKAVIQLSNGCKFEGNVQYGQIKQGILSYNNGNIYKGPIKQGMVPHGDGSLKLKSGIQYRGKFNNGIFQDRGTIIYDNGDTYIGKIKNYKKHGFGELFFVNGDKYIGDFCQGELTGQGVFYRSTGMVAEGMWKNGEYLGRKTQKFTKSSISVIPKKS